MITTLPPIDDPVQVRSAATGLISKAKAVHTRASTIRTGWHALTASYIAPESATVLAAMNPPETASTAFVAQAGKVKSALDAYADELTRLASQKSSLESRASSWNTEHQQFLDDTDTLGESIVNNFLGIREAQLMNKGQDIQSDMDAWQADCDAAQRTCANAIRALYGAPALKAADAATVEDIDAQRVFGMTAEGYHGMTQTGKTAWFDRAAWNGMTWTGNAYAIGQGAVGSVTEIKDFGEMLITGGDGRRDAFFSQMQQLGGALVTSIAYSQAISSANGEIELTDAERAEYDKANQLLLGAGKAAISYDTWGSTGFRTAGGFAPDVLMAFFSGGSITAAKVGVKTGVSAGLRAALMRGTVLAPKTAASLSRLARLLDAATLPGGSLNRNLTLVRNAGLRVQSAMDRAAAVKQATVRLPVTALTGASRRVVTAIDNLSTGGRRLTPALAGQGRLARTATTTARALDGRLGSGGGGSNLTGVQRLRAAVPEIRDDLTETVGNTTRFADSEMLVRPHVIPDHTVSVDIKGDHSSLYPKARENFGAGQDLAPNTAYEVRGRGTFYTDADGKVNFVVAERRTFSLGTGATLSRELMSSDLRTPQPNTTYVVNGTYFHTNAAGQTDHIFVPELSSQPDTLRSPAAQRNVAGGVDGYDAGHLQARELGGAREEINLVQMVSDLNRGVGGRSLAEMNSWRHLERELNRLIAEGHAPSVDISMKRDSLTGRPTEFTVIAQNSTGDELLNQLIWNK